MNIQRILGASVLLVALLGVAGWAFWPTGGSAGRDPVNDVPAAQSQTLDTLGITKAAYGAGMAALRECMVAKGIPVGDLYVDGRGLAAFDLPPVADRASIQPIRDVWQDCYFQHLDDIDRLYQQSPEFQQAAIEGGWEVLRCFEAQKPGFDASTDQRSLSEAIQGFEAAADPVFQACFSAVAKAARGDAGAGALSIAYTPLVR